MAGSFPPQRFVIYGKNLNLKDVEGVVLFDSEGSSRKAGTLDSGTC